MMEREYGGTGTYIKKGPWTAEEDEVLMNHVKKNGPRDWSSIRSKGLLPRTGKSCRLRWVNKLRPNLKTGCKFSAEEERVVIELQAQFGNKWAKIATYLEGRTDNDVKNFWSSRRKKLERMLQKPSPSKPYKIKGKAPLPQLLAEEVPSCSSNCVEEKTPSTEYKYLSYMGNTEELDMAKPELQNLEAEEATQLPIPIPMVPSFESSSEYTFSQVLPEPEPEPHQVDFPLLPDCHGLADPEPFDDANFLDIFEQHKGSDYQKLGTKLPYLALEGNAHTSTPVNAFFEDFPTEIFDYFEVPAPPPSSQK